MLLPTCKNYFVFHITTIKINLNCNPRNHLLKEFWKLCVELCGKVEITIQKISTYFHFNKSPTFSLLLNIAIS